MKLIQLISRVFLAWTFLNILAHCGVAVFIYNFSSCLFPFFLNVCVYFLGADETEENGQDDSNDGEDHECTDECGFCADDDGKNIYHNNIAIVLQ